MVAVAVSRSAFLWVASIGWCYSFWQGTWTQYSNPVIRGNNDFLGSHDLEDILTVIAGRVEISEEVALAEHAVKEYLKKTFEELLQNEQFEIALPGHVNDGPVTMQRVQAVIGRIKKRININHE